MSKKATGKKGYQPPYQLTEQMLQQVSDIAEQLGSWQSASAQPLSPRLRRAQRIRTIHASLAIEANTLSVEQITAMLAGKHVIGPPRDVQEARNAIATYEQLPQWQAHSTEHLLAAHRLLMIGLLDAPGQFRSGGVGIYREGSLVHMAPPASQVPRLMRDLLGWLAQTEAHPLIASCAFHYEFEFIHPFADGNGRMGRLWQTLILSGWKPLLAWLPVETVIRDRQDAYYQALSSADRASDATPFIHFMLDALLTALHSQSHSDQVDDQVSDQVAALLQAFKNGEGLKATDLMQRLQLKHNPSFRSRYLTPALKLGLIAMSHPDSPRSPAQRYRLTERGQLLKKRGRA